MTYRKKLIEVALPLEAINMESAREKSIRHGHPSTLHLWWARRPLAACRAVLWSSLVDDPSSWPDRFPTEEAQSQERQRLFDILGRIVIEVDRKGNQKQKVRGLVSWDDIKEPAVIEAGQREIARCLAWDRGEEPPTKPDAVRDYIAKYAPPAYDPFAGGGSIPLEAQRLGLEAHASDLNPVAVLINKALIEIPPKFKDQAPVNPEDRAKKNISSWRGAQGLAADVRYYGQWMRDRAFERIGHLYPKVEVEQDGAGKTEATVIAWLWARTVKCPNPACGCQMPLVRSFQLSAKKGKEAWVEPVIDHSQSPPQVRFEVKTGKGEVPEGTMSRKGATCIACNTPVPFNHIRSEGCAIGMGSQLMAVVAEGASSRTYCPPSEYHIDIAKSAQPSWKPEAELPNNTRDIRPQIYGLPTYGDLFTSRQLVALNTFSDLVMEARDKAFADAVLSNLPDNNMPLSDGGRGARAYGEAIACYLAFSTDRVLERHTSIATWDSSPSKLQIRGTFARQAIPMTWDFAEGNPFCHSSGTWLPSIEWVSKVVEVLPLSNIGFSRQVDAMSHDSSKQRIISTDPPYYDNIGYADLSDFFYVWLRRSLKSIYPNLFSTLLVPKAPELVATPYRFGGSKQKAQLFFEEGLGKAFNRMYETSHIDYPLTVYYAFKQTETAQKGRVDESTASTGWETMLEGLIKAGFSIGGTWPVRTELSNRAIASSANALASSIVLVCRPRPTDAPKITRRQFLTELKRQLPPAIKLLQQGNIAPVDLAQASIGPGMAIYSKYAAVLENDGTPLRVRTALQLINQILDEFQSDQEGEFDSETRWAIAWFEQNQYAPGPYGDAETLSTARNTSVKAMEDAGILTAKAGKVRLLQRDELPQDWQPETDTHLPDWEATQHLIRTLLDKGEIAASELLTRLGRNSDNARDLAYRLYTLCDRKGWTAEALAYNSLVIAWPEITRLASEFVPAELQGSLDI